MKIFQTKLIRTLVVSFFTFLFCSNTIFASLTSQVNGSVNDYIKKCPWIGLVANQITYGPITISDVKIHDGDKLALVAPGETLNGTLKYKIDSKNLESLHLYHLVIGIKNEGAQDCVVHNLGLWNSKGLGHFTLKAPDKAGIYEVRFLFTEGLTCDAARDIWNSGAETPHAATTIGVVVVEDVNSNSTSNK